MKHKCTDNAEILMNIMNMLFFIFKKDHLQYLIQKWWREQKTNNNVHKSQLEIK